MSANVDDMMYRGEKPWHKQGTKIQGASTLREIIKASGLDFNVTKRPLFTAKYEEIIDDEKEWVGEIRVPKNYATVRDDRDDVLGVVGRKYRVIQNEQAFDFLDPLVNENPQIEYHTAGALGKGEVVWILLKDNRDMEVAGDEIEKYMFLRTSHDGSCKLECAMTPVRVVCQNTLNLALSRRSGSTFSVKHTANAGDRMRRASEILKNSSRYFNNLHETLDKFVEEEFRERQLREILETKLFSTGQDGEFSKRAQNDMDKIIELSKSGSGITYDIEGTKYAAVNAVIEYSDHEKTFRATGDTEPAEARLKSILSGSAKRFKNKAVKAIAEA